MGNEIENEDAAVVLSKKDCSEILSAMISIETSQQILATMLYKTQMILQQNGNVQLFDQNLSSEFSSQLDESHKIILNFGKKIGAFNE